jgi:hypothetical protein
MYKWHLSRGDKNPLTHAHTPYSHTLPLSYSHTPILLHSHTFPLSFSANLILVHSQNPMHSYTPIPSTLILSYSLHTHTLPLPPSSYSPTPSTLILYRCHTPQLPYAFTLILLHAHILQLTYCIVYILRVSYFYPHTPLRSRTSPLHTHTFPLVFLHS